MIDLGDYYDSGTIYETDRTFSEVIDELNERKCSRADCERILYSLIDDLIDAYFWDN